MIIVVRTIGQDATRRGVAGPTLAVGHCGSAITAGGSTSSPRAATLRFDSGAEKWAAFVFGRPDVQT